LARAGKSELVYQPAGAVADLGATGNGPYYLDVLQGGEVVEQVAGLKHEADVVSAKPRQLTPGQVRQLAASDGDRSCGGGEQAADHREERRLARAAGSNDRHELSDGDVEADTANGADFSVSVLVGLVEAFDQQGNGLVEHGRTACLCVRGQPRPAMDASRHCC
jgi:hypothetical protein